jgi:hypothetical protein
VKLWLKIKHLRLNILGYFNTSSLYKNKARRF